MIVLGNDASLVHDILAEDGMPMELVVDEADTFDPVKGEVGTATQIVTAAFGYPYPATENLGRQYGFSQVQQNDLIIFIEPVIQPNTTMALRIVGKNGSEQYKILQVQAITDTGIANLYVLQVRR